NLGAAADSYTKALELDPDHVPTRLQLARLLLASGRLPAAVGQFERLLESQPHDTEVLLGLSECRRLQGRADDAVALVGKLGGDLTAGQKARSLLLQGRLALARQDLLEAKSALRRATELDPMAREALFAYAACLDQSGKPK